ncbi:conserved hypothetical protein distantly related to alpha-glycosyltransferases family 4 [Synechococcus sp. MIT S9220]|uniref:glycosyltransferase n=1 Tax=Synechococcus sp. MIT S9220 TaxID=166309 RepID=UPI00164C9E76|nr:glycosyltransferase [Synechococcus sp. MIT S9220]QNJ22055.1 conserved hypothetical protein distantly related to alpha-glycosyltransferases family 4 [Synechococcus sp. MIT S9220]
MKLLVVSTHPIQYVSPQLRLISKSVDTKVLYISPQNAFKQKASKAIDPGFGVELEWDNQILKGFDYEFLTDKPLTKVEGLRGLSHLPRLLKKINTYTPSAILFFNHAPALTLLAGIICGWTGKNIFIRTEATDQVKQRNWLISFFRDLLLRSLYSKSKCIFPITSHGRIHCEKRGVKCNRLQIVNYSPDTNLLQHESKKYHKYRTELRQLLGINYDAMVFIYAGRYSKEKDIFCIPKAFCNCQELQENNVHFISVGAGPLEREWLRRMNQVLGHNFHHLGFMNQSKICQAYAASDTLILPSNDKETWGLVINEALAMRCNVVASSLAGCVKDLSELGAPIKSFSPGSYTQLRSCLLAAKRGKNSQALFDISLLPKTEDFPNILIERIKHL